MTLFNKYNINYNNDKNKHKNIQNNIFTLVMYFNLLAIIDCSVTHEDTG